MSREVPTPTQEGRTLHGTAEDLSFLRTIGLHVDQLTNICNELAWEAPARLNSALAVGSVSMGAFTYLGPGCELRRTRVGRFCSIAANVGIGVAEHPTDWLSSHPFAYDGVQSFDLHEEWSRFTNPKERYTGNKGATTIGHDVWIGRNVVVRQGINIGPGAIVGAGSFVNRDVPPYAVVGGAPARVLRYRFPEELISRLLAIQWWNWELRPVENHLPLSDIAAAVDRLEDLVRAGSLKHFNPRRFQLLQARGSYSLVSQT